MRATTVIACVIALLTSTQALADLGESSESHANNAISQETPASPSQIIGGVGQNDRAKYVSINIEFSGLDESTALLNESMDTLSLSLSQAAKSPGDLSVEQINALESLVAKTDDLILSLQSTLQGFEPMIRNTQQPAQEMLAGLLQTTRAETMDPLMSAIQHTGSKWISLMLFGAVLIISLMGAALYFTTRQLRQFAGILKSISSEYEIVRREDTK